MFCVGCGSKMEETWGHCPSCGAERAAASNPEPEYYQVTVEEAPQYMSETNFAHWMASGQPWLAYINDRLVGFRLDTPEQMGGFVQFARWIIRDEDIRDWYERGIPLIEDYFPDYEEPDCSHKNPVLSAEEVQATLSPSNYDIWYRSGQVDISIDDEGHISFGNIFNQYIWAMNTTPPTYENPFDFLHDE